eukprot:16438917-Heterocapsa_arctica.AAC.1
MEMNGNQVRQSILEKANLYWNEVFEYNIEGEEFINLLQETGDRNQWGGANQMAIFAKMENIKIDVYSHGIPCKTYEYDSHGEQNKNTISVLWCNINRWGAQENHYDLLFPIRKETKRNKTFKYNFFENSEAENNKCNWEANTSSNYVSRRGNNEVERGTNITTLNVSGSLQDFEWVLENTEDHIVLIQEHWRLPSEMEAWKSAAYRKGWTG